MTYILILASRTDGWPAVIGGYATAEEADTAGRIAIQQTATEKWNNLDTPFGPDYEEWRDWFYRPWNAYTVIPGVAQMPPLDNHGVNV